MSGMLQEVLRWQRLARVRTPGDRWSGWAQSLSERHGRLPYRRRTPGMTLTQLPALLWCFQRWESAAWTLSPRIHLALGPILAETVWKGFPLLGPGQAHRESPQMSVAAGAGVLALQRVERRPMSDDRLGVSLPEGDPACVLERLGAPWQVPLQRGFVRTDWPDYLSRGQRVSHLAQESLQILRRVVDQRQRVEAMVHTTAVAQLRKDPAADFTATARSVMDGQVTTQPLHGWSTGTSMAARAAPPPAIDIEQLTEQVVRQIDRRIVAHRERMGRLF